MKLYIRYTLLTVIPTLIILVYAYNRGIAVGEARIVKLVPYRPTETYRVTAYCKGSCCCGKWADGITASGAKAQGKLIAAPKEIPFGTWIDIPGYGYAEVLDRGGSIKGKRLDVFFPTHQEALNWGVQYLEIKK